MPSVSQVITTDSVASITAALVNEGKVKERRQLNLVLQSSSSDGSIRKAEDIKRVRSMFEKYLDVSVFITKAFRISKKGAKPRLLKIAVTSLDEKISVPKMK